ncbi:DUF4150 domain-containing protein [Salipiger bermudensis]|uniref:DUF4150 domain-containing protein n=1 Tax=Salipiger bermudensis TaxID=344736 RepID=UPI001CD48296|nr:DUF4150 domain-containing protein [Salipiger bermudensis]MCA0963377.1 DUF4150 domain-containing protein [Salipiger bermudensis]
MTVFANSLEISAKAQGCRIIAAFPDTCFTPPQTPATPPGVPLPYPNFATDSDLTSGTGTVKIGGQEISQENSSYFSKISGDEAGCAPKKGIITSKNMGKAYAQKWSMDVKAEGKGVVRFTDLATTNHQSNTGNDAPWIIVGKPNPNANPDGSACIVGEYRLKRDDCSKNKDSNGKPYQFHHVVPDRTYRCGRYKAPGLTPMGNIRRRDVRQSFGPSHGQGICICLPPDNHVGSKKSAPGTAVHQELDDKLTALGQKTKSATSPAGCAPLKEVRLKCLIALHKLVPKTISMKCFKLALEEVMKQTEPHKDKQVRAEKNLKNLSRRARGVLARQ